MAQVRKLNRILTIEECKIDDFLEMGYDLIDGSKVWQVIKCKRFNS